MCQFITDAIQESFDDGSWEEAFNRTLGESGVEAPQPPELDECEDGGGAAAEETPET